MFLIGTVSSIINNQMNRTAEMIEENAANSFAEADIKKVLGYIKQAGEKGIRHGDLVKKLWRMSANNRKNAISTLLESEKVSVLRFMSKLRSARLGGQSMRRRLQPPCCVTANDHIVHCDTAHRPLKR